MSPLFCFLIPMIQKHTVEQLTEQIIQQGDDAAASGSLFLVEVLVSASGERQKITVYVDGDEGVSVETCAKISRKLAEALDEDNPDLAYTLEVSSPGLDQPLKLERQYKKNIGRTVRVVLQDNQTVKGRLVQVNPERITLAEETRTAGKKKETKERHITFTNIIKTNVLASFK